MNGMQWIVPLVGLAAIPAVYRLLGGPSRADRVVALDLLFAVAVVLCLCAGVATGRTGFVDVAIGLVLTGFVGTLAWARLVDRSAAREKP